MGLFFRFEYIHFLYFIIPLFILIVAARRYFHNKSVYQYPLVGFLVKQYKKLSELPAQILYFLRFFSLMILMILMIKPQLIDKKSKITVEGIDIALVLDVSGSMQLFDDVHDRRTRIEVAKEEAIRFIDKRDNDAIGLVIFGKYSITRCPLTSDKIMLKSIVEKIDINQNDGLSQGTVLSQSIVTAARRLQKSKAKSKIMILLTDGAPTQEDIPPQDALNIAEAFGIKIYTIGIGSAEGGLFQDPSFGIRRVGGALNQRLLQVIAEKTGGMFFEAKHPKDVAKIYDTIDSLEKSSYQADIFTKYHDYFMPLLWLAICLIMVELFLSTFFWTII